MTKITKIEPKTYQGKISGYKIELSDGTFGYLDDKASDKGLRQGDDVTVQTEQKVNKKGEPYNLFTLKLAGSFTPTPTPTFTPTPAAQPSIHIPEKTPLSVNSKIDHKVQAAIKAMEFCMDTFAAEKLEWDMVIAKQREVVATLWSEIDAVYTEK